MKTKEIKKAIEALGPWNQRYTMGRLYTADSKISGEDVWPDIRSMMDEDLHGARIMDLGSGSGYYSVMLAMEGADVIAVEPNKLYRKQTSWTKYFFEQRWNKEIPLEIVKKSASDIKFLKLKQFDYILALSVIFYIGKESGGIYSEGAMNEQKRVVSEMCKITDKILVTTENNKIGNSIGYHNGLFLENEFYMLKRIMQKRPILLYGRLIKE